MHKVESSFAVDPLVSVTWGPSGWPAGLHWAGLAGSAQERCPELRGLDPGGGFGNPANRPVPARRRGLQFTRTSAQFDEGGAKGLLLLNLSVWGGCNVVFDSNAVPAQEMAAVQHAGDAVFDMTALAKHIPRVLLERPCLTPTLSAITSLVSQLVWRSRTQPCSARVPCGPTRTHSSSVAAPRPD